MATDLPEQGTFDCQQKIRQFGFGAHIIMNTNRIGLVFTCVVVFLGEAATANGFVQDNNQNAEPNELTPLDFALTCTRSIDGTNHRRNLLEKIASAVAASGDFKKAVSIIRQNETSYHAETKIRNLANELVRFESYDNAIRVSNESTDDTFKHEVVRQLMQVIVKYKKNLGDIASLVETLPKSEIKDRHRIRLVEIWLAEKEYRLAKQVAERIDKVQLKNDVLLQIEGEKKLSRKNYLEAGQMIPEFSGQRKSKFTERYLNAVINNVTHDKVIVLVDKLQNPDLNSNLLLTLFVNAIRDDDMKMARKLFDKMSNNQKKYASFMLKMGMVSDQDRLPAQRAITERNGKAGDAEKLMQIAAIFGGDPIAKELLSQAAIAYAKQGDIEKSRELIAQKGLKNLDSQVKLDFTKWSLLAGKKEKAMPIISDYQRLAANQKSRPYREGYHARMVSVMSEAKEFQLAIEYANSCDPFPSSAVSRMIKEMVRTKTVKESIELIALLKQNFNDVTLAEAAKARLGQGRESRAVEIAKLIKSVEGANSRSAILSFIARKLLDQELYLFKYRNTPPPPEYRRQVAASTQRIPLIHSSIKEIPSAEMRAGMLLRLLTLTRKIDDARNREALKKDTRQAIESVSNPRKHLEYEKSFAWELVLLGDDKAAEEIAQNQEGTKTQDQLRRTIKQAQSHRKVLEEASKHLEVQDYPQGDVTRLALGIVLANKGQVTTAIEICESIEREFDRDQLYSAIVRRLYADGDYALAKTTKEKIRNISIRQQLDFALMVAYLRAGKYEETVETIFAMDEVMRRERALVMLVEELCFLKPGNENGKKMHRLKIKSSFNKLELKLARKIIAQLAE